MNASTTSSCKPKKIFISYPHKTAAHVALMQHIRKLLEQRGYATWLDGDELKVGDDWRSRIVEGLLETDFVLAFLSKHSMRDPGVCRNEISLTLHAKSSDDLLITALLEDEGIMHAPLTLAHIQPVDLTDFETLSLELNSPEGMQKLEDAVNQLVQRMESGKNVAGNMTILRKRLQPASYIAEIAQKSAAFEGRKWLFEEIQTWQDDFNAPRVFALQGSAGVGKSAISAHLTNYRSSVFGIHFCKYNDVSTHSTNNLVRTMAFQLASRHKVYAAKLIHTLADNKYSDDKIFNIPGDQLFDDLIIHLTQTIAVTDDERKMFIVDGLDEATVNGENAILELISTKFSALPNWLGVLVTSRPEASIVDALPGTYVLNADDKRNQNDVRSYLTKGLGKVDVLAKDDSLLNKAVDIASAKAAGVMLYASELLRALREGYINPLQPDEFPNGLGGLYFLSLQRHYPNKDQYYNGKPAVADLLELIACSPLPITERLLLGIADISSETLIAALAPLNTLLVRKPKSGENADTIELFHKSFADWLLEDHAYQLNGDGATTIGKFLYQTFRSIETQDLSKVSSEYLAEIDTLLPLCLPTMAVWGETKELENLWKWFFERERYNASFIPINHVVDLNKETLGPEHITTLMKMNDLASTLSKQGFLDAAREHQEHILTVFKEINCENNPFALIIKNNLASTFRQQGQLGQALDLQMETLNAWSNESTLSEEETAHSKLLLLGNVVLTLIELGEYDQAIKLAHQVIDTLKMVFDNTHSDVLTAMSNLGLALYKARKLEDAREVQELVLQIQLASSNPTNLLTLSSMLNLSGTLSDLGDLDRAYFFQKSVSEEFQKQLGSQHPNTLSAMSGLALTLFRLENLNDCLKLQQYVLAKQKETLGKNHPHTLVMMSNLAITLNELKQIEAARELLHQAFDISNETLGDNHPETLNFMALLGCMYFEQKEFTKSENFFEMEIRAYQETLGEAHEKTISRVTSLAKWLSSKGDHIRARNHLEQTIAACKRELGNTNPSTLKCINRLAFTLCEQKEFNEAVRLLKQTLQTCKASLGEFDDQTVTIMNNLGHTYYKQGSLSKAREIQEDILKIRRQNLGLEHADTLASMLNLVLTVNDQGDLARGRSLQEELLASYKNLMHPNHPKILECKLNIGYLSFQMDEFAYGIKYLTELREQIEHCLGDDDAQRLKAINDYLASAAEADDYSCGEIYMDFVSFLSKAIQELKEYNQ